MQHITGLRQIIDDYDLFILDLWGVIHDGDQPYPYSVDAVEHLRKAGKSIAFMSNAPRRAARAIKTLSGFGVPRDYYHVMITSGEVGFRLFESGEIEKYNLHIKQDYYYIGPVKDEGIIDELGYKSVDSIKDASFILCTGLEDNILNLKRMHEQLQVAKEHSVPMICLNPDIVVIKQSGEKILCSGFVAEEYSKLGGKVIQFGKPFKEIYEMCLEEFPDIPRDRVICIGDNLETDIKGADSAELKSVFVTGGIYAPEFSKAKTSEEKTALVNQLSFLVNTFPDYFIDLFRY